MYHHQGGYDNMYSGGEQEPEGGGGGFIPYSGQATAGELLQQQEDDGGGGSWPWDEEGSQTTQRQQKKKLSDHSLTPVTLHMLQQAQPTTTSNAWLFKNKKLAQVIVVARVHSQTPSSSHITYELEDSTGLMTAVRFVSESDPQETENLLTGDFTNTYVKVVGRLQGDSRTSPFNSAPMRTLILFHIHQLDFSGGEGNLLTCHLLDVMLSSERVNGKKREKMEEDEERKIQYGVDLQGAGYGYQPAAATGLSAPPPAASTGYFPAPPVAPSPLAYLTPSQQLTGATMRVLNALTCHPGNQPEAEGVRMDELMQQLGMTPEQFGAVMDELNENNKIYSTIDNNHFKLTDM